MEKVDTLGMMMARLPKSPGKLVWERLYTPSQTVAKEVQLQLDGVKSAQIERKVAREGLEHDEVSMACLACSA
jgi:hypothetical protein